MHTANSVEISYSWETRIFELNRVLITNWINIESSSPEASDDAADAAAAVADDDGNDEAVDEDAVFAAYAFVI